MSSLLTSTRLFLVRHGEVEDAWQGRIYGALDVPLSDRGREEGARVARSMRGIDLVTVVSSGLSRTEHLASCLREERGLVRIDDRDLRELERGEWAGSARSELEARWPGAWDSWFSRPSTSRPSGGESLDDLLRRVRPRVEHWTSASLGGSIALVTHGWVIRVLVCDVLGLPLDTAPRLDVRTADLSVIQWPVLGQAPVLESFALDSLPGQLSE